MFPKKDKRLTEYLDNPNKYDSFADFGDPTKSNGDPASFNIKGEKGGIDG